MSGFQPRLELDKIVHFHLPGENEWRRGRTRNVSRSGLLFVCDEPIEVGTIIEMCLPDQELRFRENKSLPCFGTVVRRVLMAWPEVRPLIGVRFLEDTPQDVWSTSKVG